MSELILRWVTGMVNATVQGSITLIAATLVARYATFLPPVLRIWLLRLAFFKLILCLVWQGGIGVVLPGEPSSTEMPVWLGFLLDFAFVVWAVTVAIGVWRTVQSIQVSRQIIKESTMIREGRPYQVLHYLSRVIGVSRVPTLAENPGLRSPMLALGSPGVILIPAGLSDSEDISAVIAHELAHVRNRDLAWSWLPWLADTLFFFNPVVTWSQRMLRHCEECAADRSAMRALGISPGPYSRTLLNFTGQHPREAHGLGLGESAAALQARILEAFDQRRSRSLQLIGFGLVAAIALTLVPLGFRSGSDSRATEPRTPVASIRGAVPVRAIVFPMGR